MERKFMKVDEAAEVFGISKYTIRKWARLGLIDAVRVGNRWLIKIDTLEKKLTKKDDKHDEQ